MSTAKPFRPVPDLGVLDTLFEHSTTEPVVLYLHDPHCPVSADAFEEMEKLPGGSWLIDVSRQHDLKRQVAERTGVRHESPQVIVLRDGAPTWHASHYRITRSAVEAAVTQ
jgi:bacillithiol system protein YtxJ